MNNIKLICDSELDPADYGLYLRFGKTLLGKVKKQYLTGQSSYAIFIANGIDVKIICFKLGGSFVSIPRLLNVNDGYGDDLKPLGDGTVTYPLNKAELSSSTLSIDEDGLLTLSRDNYLFGNVDWKGKRTTPETEQSDAPVLTWKGPLGRTLPFDYTQAIDGLTTPDIVFSPDDPPKHTCFGRHIYQEGSILASVPTDEVDVEPKVLGCALSGNTLVCVVVNHYPNTTGFYEEVWRYDGDSALYDAVKHPSGLRRLSSRVVGRPSLCWFFNSSGTEATQAMSKYSINLKENTATYTTEENEQIKYVVTSDIEGNHATAYSGETVVWSDYKDDTRVFAKVSASGGHRFTPSTAESSSMADVKMYIQGEQPMPTGIGGPDVWTGNAGDYYLIGASGSVGAVVDGNTVTLTGSAGCDTVERIITANPTTGTQEISYTAPIGDVEYYITPEAIAYYETYLSTTPYSIVCSRGYRYTLVGFQCNNSSGMGYHSGGAPCNGYLNACYPQCPTGPPALAGTCGYDSYAMVLRNTPDNGVMIIHTWQYSPRTVGHCIGMYNTAAQWTYTRTATPC